MTSSVAWLDYDDEQRRKMRDVVHMFRDQGAVDELGIGRVRDAFSNRLFPGTSVLWRRARYLLFVPWIYMRLEEGQGRRGSAEEQARRLQRQLARTLRESEGEAKGVIGASGADVKQPPDVILWAALGAWGLRLDLGSLVQVREMAVRRGLRRGGLEEDQVLHHDVWSPHVRRLLPESFPEEASFTLTEDEAAFLRAVAMGEDAVAGTSASERADSLLAVLIEEGVPANVEAPWGHPMESASGTLREIVRHAGLFSDLIFGARLLYADLVLRSRADAGQGGEADESLSADVDTEFAEWLVHLTGDRLAEMRRWFDDHELFWHVVRLINSNVESDEERFVRSWAEVLLADPGAVRDSPEARRLLVRREQSKKGVSRARLTLDGSIGRDAEAVMPTRFNYRWDQAVSIARDIRGES